MEELKGIHTIDNSEKKDHGMECWALDCLEGVVLVHGHNILEPEFASGFRANLQRTDDLPPVDPIEEMAIMN